MTFKPKAFVLILLIGLMAVVITGCGGGKGGSSDGGLFGSATLTVLWPTRANSAPDVQSLKITMLDSGNAIAERTINRPDQGNSSIVSIDPLPTGSFTARVRGYALTNAGGSPNAEASSKIAIQTGQDTKMSFATAGTVDRIEVTAPSASVQLHGTTKLTATPMNADGVIVLLPSGSIKWDSSNSAVAAVDTDGLVQGLVAGTSDIQATDSTSGQSATLRMTVTGTRWTVMVYMAADNNLETYGIQDMNELESVGSTEDVSVVAQMDRSSSYDTSNGNWSGARRYYVTHDDDTSTIHSQLISDLGTTDMASPETLTDFIQWATTNYPAEHYLLVVWDHGRGWRSPTEALLNVPREVKSICIDDSAHDEMSLSKLTQALNNAHRADIVLFDACLMGMTEVAYAIKDNADIMISSEENVPVQGQAYGQLLNHIVSNPQLSPNDFSHAIVDDYINFYSDGYGGTFTLSAINLHALDQLTAATDQLATAITSNLGAVRSSVEAARSSTQHFDFDKGEYRYYRDLYDFARLIHNEVPNAAVNTAAQGVMSAVNNTVLYEGHLGSGVQNAHGISIYLPDPGTALSQYNSLGYSQATHWDDLVANY